MDSKIHSPLEISVQRPAFNQESFQENYAFTRPRSKGCWHATKKILSKEFTSERLKKGAKARVPFVDTLRNYSKNYIVGDIVAGITVGIMQIPLGMAYALLGNCPPETGLYTSFFPVLIYFFFGTSRHISQGTFAITSLMFSGAVAKYSTPTLPSAINSTTVNVANASHNLTGIIGESVHSETGFTAIQVASAICLISGVVQILMGIFRLGQLSIYMSDTLISGFTTGAALLVFTSQFSTFFGIKVPNAEWNPETIYTYTYVFSHISATNVATLVVSLVAIVVLAFTCEVVNPWVQPKIKVPIPIELITVVIGTGLSYALDFKDTYDVVIVGDIPPGIPAPEAPPVFKLFSNVIVDSIAIGVVTYIISYSLGKIFAKKHNYDINANQEFLAMGAANFISSFFHCFPMCVALSRSMVLDSVGGMTQVAGLLSSGVVLVVLLAIAKLFKTLPNCILAAIIVVGIRRMFLQFRDFFRAWKISKLEALTWMITFLAVSLTKIDIGLGIGVIFSVLTIVFRSQSPYITLLGWVKETDLYVDIRKYPTAHEEKGIKIYHYGGPILFANSKSFRKTLYDVTDVNPRIIGKKLEKLKKGDPEKTLSKLEKQGKLNSPAIDVPDSLGMLKQQKNNSHVNGVTNPSFDDNDAIIASKYERKLSIEKPADGAIIDELNEKNTTYGSTDKIWNDGSRGGFEDKNHNVDMNDVGVRRNHVINTIISNMRKELRYIIIDGSSISFVDFSGVAALIQVVEEYERIGVSVFLATLTGPVLDMLDTSEFYQKFSTSLIYPTVRDAVLHAHMEVKKDIKLNIMSSTKL